MQHVKIRDLWNRLLRIVNRDYATTRRKQVHVSAVISVLLWKF